MKSILLFIFRKRWINLLIITTSIVTFHIFIGWAISFTYVLLALYILIFPKASDIIYSFDAPYVDTTEDIITPIFIIWLKVYIIVLIIDFLFFRKRKKKVN